MPIVAAICAVEAAEPINWNTSSSRFDSDCNPRALFVAALNMDMIRFVTRALRLYSPARIRRMAATIASELLSFIT